MTIGDRFKLGVLWFIAVSLMSYHGIIAYYYFAPSDLWYKYYYVLPKKEQITTDETMYWISYTDLYEDLIMRFNDILYKWNEEEQEFDRYNAQPSERLHSLKGEGRVTRWPFRPTPQEPGIYCLESNIRAEVVTFIGTVIKSERHDGCLAGVTVEVIEPEEE